MPEEILGGVQNDVLRIRRDAPYRKSREPKERGNLP